MPDWVIWAILSVLFAVGEIFTPGLFFLGPIALAALAATVVAALGGGLLVQIIVFGVGSFAAGGVPRPLAPERPTVPRASRPGAPPPPGPEADVPPHRGTPRRAVP